LPKLLLLGSSNIYPLERILGNYPKAFSIKLNLKCYIKTQTLSKNNNA
jgi:hypothetical protein